MRRNPQNQRPLKLRQTLPDKLDSSNYISRESWKYILFHLPELPSLYLSPAIPNPTMVRCLALFISLAAATSLYATHYDGNIYTLSFDSGNSLSITSSLKTCGDAPSWLTFDSSTRTLYCSDHSGNGTINGSLSSYFVNQEGKLTELAKTVDVGSAVHSTIYGGKHGREKYLAIAH